MDEDAYEAQLIARRQRNTLIAVGVYGGIGMVLVAVTVWLYFYLESLEGSGDVALLILAPALAAFGKAGASAVEWTRVRGGDLSAEAEDRDSW